MKKFFSTTTLLILMLSTGILNSCKKETLPQDIPTVSQFVYDGMSAYYLWNNEMTGKKPMVTDTDPKKYFKSILYKTDIENNWSWITDDIEAQLRDFAGEATHAFGFSPYVLWTDKNKTQFIALVRYTYPNTPATESGIVRGDVITKINGEIITLSNYMTLFGANSETTFTVLDQGFQNAREVKVTPRSFSTDPVLYSNIYEINGKKIGYLFYTSFRSNFNQSLFRVFKGFQQAGITDLVLDLRYNPGGDVSAATYLASLIAPKADVEKKSVFSIMSYNKELNAEFDRRGWEREDRLGEYDDKNHSNPLDANPNLSKVYILATESSASASELTAFCLRPYTEVVLIGQNTSGKYTASWTLHAYNNFLKDGYPRAQAIYRESSLSSTEKAVLKNWGIQPIVGRYTDKDGKDFVNDGALIPNYPIRTQEKNTETWKPIGDENDYLFAKAISLITGRAYTQPVSRSAEGKQWIDAELYSPSEELRRRAVIIDNIDFDLTPDDFKK